jgi:hypothetical protein
MSKTRTKKSAAPQGPVKPAHTLAQIAEQIRTLEKRTIHTVIETGKWLEEAAEQLCDHGEYMKWVKAEFSWSHSTTLNYRNVYALAKIVNFTNLNAPDISISGLYLAARFLKADQPTDVQAAGNAILDAAKQHRVSFTEACDIADQHLNPAKFNRHDVGSSVCHEDSGAAPYETDGDDETDDAGDTADDIDAGRVTLRGYRKDSDLQKLAKLSGPKMERKYTALIKRRELKEGDCELPWADYFDYRDTCSATARLTADDIAYVALWTSAARPTPDDEALWIADESAAEETEVDDGTPASDDADAAAPSIVAESAPAPLIADAPAGSAHLQLMLDTPLDDPFWSSFARHVGPAKLREFIIKLQVVCDRHCAMPAEVGSDNRSAAEVAEQATKDRAWEKEPTVH